MLLITGEVDRITTRKAGTPGREWDEQTIVVQDWGVTLYCTVARDFGDLPLPGEKVALVVSVRAYVRKDGQAGHGFTALRRNVDAESSIFGRQTSPASTGA